MNNYKRGIKRILAGALAVLIIVTTLPEASMLSLAKEISSPDNETEIIFSEPEFTPISENISINSDYNTHSEDTVQLKSIESDIETDPNSSSTTYENDAVLPNYDSIEEPSNLGEGSLYTVNVQRNTFSMIERFSWEVYDENGVSVTSGTSTFASNSSVAKITWESDLASDLYFKITDVTTTNDTYFVYIGNDFVNDNRDFKKYKAEPNSAIDIVLSASQITIKDVAIKLPTKDNFVASTLDEVSGYSYKIGNDIYASSKVSTKVTLSIADESVNPDISNYNLDWITNSKPSSSYTGNEGKKSISGTMTQEGTKYTCEFSNGQLSSAIKAGASSIEIVPNIKATHSVTIHLADNDISNSLTSPKLTYSIYDYNNSTPITTVPNKPLSKVGFDITVPDGGYITFSDVTNNNDTLYFETVSYTADGATKPIKADDSGNCVIPTSKTMAFHGDVSVEFAKYNYKVWQGLPEDPGYGEKALIHVAASKYNVTFTDGLMTNGYYDVWPVDDSNWNDVVFTFNSPDIIDYVSCVYDGMSSPDKALYEKCKPVSKGESGLLVAPSGGHGLYTFTIPGALIKKAKNANSFLDVKIHPVDVHTLTMQIDKKEASASSSRATITVEFNEINYTTTTTGTNKITHTGTEADSLRLLHGTTVTVTTLIEDKNLHKYAISGVIVDGDPESNDSKELTMQILDKTNGCSFTYTIEKDTTLEITTVDLPYLSIAKEGEAVKEVSGDESYKTDGSKFESIKYDKSATLQYKYDDVAQKIVLDVSVAVDGVPLDDDKNKEWGIYTYPNTGGKEVSFNFRKIPGKTVSIQIGGVALETDESGHTTMVSQLPPRYFTFQVTASNYALTVLEATDGLSSDNTNIVVKSALIKDGPDAEISYNKTDNCYYIPVLDTTDPKATFKLEVTLSDENKIRYQLDSIKIGSKDITASASVGETIMGDTTVNVSLSSLIYLSYVDPADSKTKYLIGKNNEAAVPVTYTDTVDVQGFVGNVSQNMNDYLVYVGTSDSVPGTQLEGIAKNGLPKVSDVISLSKSSTTRPFDDVMTVDFSKCASTDEPRYVMIFFGQNPSSKLINTDGSQKQIVFELAKIPSYTIDLKVNGTTPSTSSFAQLTVKDITTSTAGTTLTPVDSTHPYTYVVKDQTKIKVTTEIPTQYSEQYELDHVKANGTKDDTLSTGMKTNSYFEFTADASTTVAPAAGSSATTAGTATLDVITLPKTYLSYKLNNDNAVIIAKATDNHKYTADGITPYSDVAVIQYYTGNVIEDLKDDYSVMVGNATLGKNATATTPAIDSVATYNESTKALTIRFENVPDSKVVIKIGKVKTGSAVPVQKVLTYETGSLPTRYLTINVNGVSAETTPVAAVTVKDKKSGQILTPITGTEDSEPSHIGKYGITAMTDIVITADINDDHKLKYNFSGATDQEDLAGSTAAATDPAPTISADKLNLTLEYKVTTSKIVNLTTDALTNLEYTYPSGTGTPISIEGIPGDPIYDVNYDQTASVRYLIGDTPEPLATKYKVYIGDKDTEPTMLLSDNTTPKLGQVITSTVSNTMIVDFTQCPNKTLRVVIGGGSTTLEEREMRFNVTALRSHKIQVLVDGVAATASTHAQVTITRVTAASAQTPVVPDSAGYCIVSERDILTITSSNKNTLKYQLDSVKIDGTADPYINPASFTYTVGIQDAVINIITRGLPYISYTSSGTSGYLEGETASSAGDITADYAGTTRIQYMMGDNPQAISLKDIVISMDNRVLTDVATDIYPAREDVMSLLDGARTLSLDFDSKKCRDHIFKIVIGDGTKLTRREISFKVPVIYTINYFDANGQAGTNNVIAVENYFYMNNIRLISGTSTGAGTCTGTYDNDKKGNIVFALADSSNCSIDDIRKVEYMVEGSPAMELTPDDRGYYTLTRQLLEEFITNNKTIILILTTEPAVYETSLKLAPGINYAPLYYNTDNTEYEVAYPVWSKNTTARKFQKIELYDESGEQIAAFDGITASGTYAGAIKYTTDRYSGISIKYNPGTTYTDGATTYHMPAGSYTILAYAREPYSIEVTAKYSIKLGQGITRLDIDSNTQYLMKSPGKTATLKATALYYGGNRKTNGIFAEDTVPTTKNVIWYPGDAAGNALSVNDPFYGMVTVRTGVFTLSKNAPSNGVFYIWAKAADFTGNTVKAGRKVTVTPNKLTFTSVSMAYSGAVITNGASFEAYQVFGSSTKVNGTNHAYDRIVLKNGSEDVTGSFTIKVSGASNGIYKDGILFNTPGTITVTATANDGSKNTLKFSFTILYGQGSLGYVLKNENFGLIDQSALEQVTDYRRNVTVSNPYPASAGLHLSVFGLNKDGTRALINNKVKIKGGKITSKSQNIRSTEYVITPNKTITSIIMTDEFGVDYTLTIQNKGLNLRQNYRVTAYNRNPVNGSDNTGRIYNYINYRQTETSLYYNKAFFVKYSDSRCNRVTYTFKNAQVGRSNVVLIETSSPYMGEIFLANGLKPVSTYEDGSGLYVTYLINGQFSIDYTMDDLGYLNIPKGRYQLYFTPGSAATNGGDINMSTFNAHSKPVKYTLQAVKAPTAKVSVGSTIKLDKFGHYGKLVFKSSSNIIKSSATFDMSSLKMAGQRPLKSVNKNGVINNFANDYEVSKINHADALVFTCKGSTWLLDDSGHISHKTASTNRMLNGYVPYAYQNADGTVTFDYALVVINDHNDGLTKY